jgi:hypothetical protein
VYLCCKTPTAPDDSWETIEPVVEPEVGWAKLRTIFELIEIVAVFRSIML